MTYLSISGEGNGVVRTTGYFCHSLAEEVGRHQGGGQPMVSGPISQLAIAIMTPGKDLTIYTAADKLSYLISVITVVNIKRKTGQNCEWNFCHWSLCLENHRHKSSRKTANATITSGSFFHNFCN